jgi:hypothetical protein
MKKVIFFMSFTLTLFLVQCKKDTVDTTTTTCTGATPTYTNTIKTIMDRSCATPGCHNATTKSNGYDLSTYTGTSAGASNAAFLGAIRHTSGFKAMPQGAAKLTDSLITKVACWVQNGKPQ